ncbi:Uncharacterised protein [Klebsiella pneumoniae]|nr:Uncharacterised protein [Klebsiella pneumoniae]
MLKNYAFVKNVDTYSRYDPEVSTSGIDTGYIRRLSGM